MRKKMNIVVGILSMLVVLGGLYGYWRWSQWEEYTGTAIGTRVDGDPDVPATNTASHLYLRVVGWKMTAVLEISRVQAECGYHLGYIPFEGKPRFHTTVFYDTRFRMRVGHEDPTFFAVSTDGSEIPLTLVARTPVNNPEYADVPLH
ncbi:hypothetical protein KBD18_02370 [Patescibacteria group bacterium]|nr:hypothetical protein [Patescibacteria group bacterium]